MRTSLSAHAVVVMKSYGGDMLETVIGEHDTDSVLALVGSRQVQP